MPEQVEKVADPESKAPEPTPKELELQEQLSQVIKLTTDMTDQQKLAQEILADPDVQALLRLKKDGKQFQLGPKEPEPEPQSELDKLLADAEGNEETELTAGQVLESLKSSLPGIIQGELKSVVDPLNQQIKAMQTEKATDEQNARKAALTTEVETAAKQHSDLADFADDMTAIEERTRLNGMTVEDAYLLAKVKKIGLPDPQAESEYPTNMLGLISRGTGAQTEASSMIDATRGKAEKRDFGQALADLTRKKYG